jgi:COP9 signalosome complex subunit 6
VSKDNTSTTKLSHSTLRHINSVLSNLSLLTPAEQSTFSTEFLSQSNDVLLVSLLGQLGENVKALRELGRKTATIQAARQVSSARKNPSSMIQRSFDEELFATGNQGGPDSGMYS